VVPALHADGRLIADGPLPSGSLEPARQIVCARHATIMHRSRRWFRCTSRSTDGISCRAPRRRLVELPAMITCRSVWRHVHRGSRPFDGALRPRTGAAATLSARRTPRPTRRSPGQYTRGSNRRAGGSGLNCSRVISSSDRSAAAGSVRPGDRLADRAD
jgi:hypothetical protein